MRRMMLLLLLLLLLSSRRPRQCRLSSIHAVAHNMPPGSSGAAGSRRFGRVGRVRSRSRRPSALLSPPAYTRQAGRQTNSQTDSTNSVNVTRGCGDSAEVPRQAFRVSLSYSPTFSPDAGIAIVGRRLLPMCRSACRCGGRRTADKSSSSASRVPGP